MVSRAPSEDHSLALSLSEQIISACDIEKLQHSGVAGPGKTKRIDAMTGVGVTN